MKQFDENYWYQHICYAMDKVDQPPKKDEGNFQWSRDNVNRLLKGEPPFGLTGHKCVVGYMMFVSNYYPEKLDQSLKVMIDYIEDMQKKKNQPLKRVHEYLLNLHMENK